MREFADARNRTWKIRVTVREVRKVLFDTGVNLANALDDDCAVLLKLSEDPILLTRVLFSLVEDQVKEARRCEHDRPRPVDGQARDGGCYDCEEDFASELDGNVIDTAVKALLDEVIDFFPPARRGIMRAMLDKTTALQEKGARAIVKVIEGPALEDRLKEALAEAPIPVDLDAGASPDGN